MRDSVVFYRSFADAIRGLPPDQFKACAMAIIDYALDGIEPEGSGIEKTVFCMAKPQIDRGLHFLEKQNGRHCAEYKKWRKSVFERDDYTCQICGKKGCELNAHHIKSFSRYPNFRYDVSNGITLCKKCHKEVHRIER